MYASFVSSAENSVLRVKVPKYDNMDIFIALQMTLQALKQVKSFNEKKMLMKAMGLKTVLLFMWL